MWFLLWASAFCKTSEANCQRVSGTCSYYIFVTGDLGDHRSHQHQCRILTCILLWHREQALHGVEDGLVAQRVSRTCLGTEGSMGVTGSCPGCVAHSIPKDIGSCLQGAVCHALVFDVPLEELDEDLYRHGHVHVKELVGRLSVHPCCISVYVLPCQECCRRAQAREQHEGGLRRRMWVLRLRRPARMSGSA